MTNFNIERKSYSKLTAQIAKNMVKKKILEIRTRGARAVDEMIDEILEKAQNGTKKAQNSVFGDKILSAVEKNRAKWRNFIIELAGRFEPDTLSTFGVNLIYGGIMTLSVGNTSWASVITIDGSDQRTLVERLSQGRSKGNLVWILRGKGTFSSETLKSLKYFPECAFMLVNNGRIDHSALSGLKNILIILKSGEKGEETELQRRGIPYLFAPESDDIFVTTKEKGRGVQSFSSSSFMSFIEAPIFPIVINDLLSGLNLIENQLSGGKSHSIPHYFA